MDDRLEKLATLYRAHTTVLKLRHDRALGATGYDHAVIFGGAQHIAFLDDHPYPFKVNPHFKWWVPVVDNPNCFIVYTPGVKPKLVFWQPIDYWYKPADTPSGWWTAPFDIEIIRNPEDAKNFIPKGHSAFIGEWNDTFESWGDLEPNPDPLLTRLHYDRAYKTEYEIECIRGANEVGARGHIAAEKAYREGESEFEIHIAYLLGTLQAEEELPYANIIALNDHGSVLHYVNHVRQRHERHHRHSFLIDAGGQFNGYASDITRTHSEKRDEFRDLIKAMDSMQQSVCAEVKPKVNYIDLHVQAHQKIAQILADFKFVNDLDANAIVEKRISSAFFPHGLGHFLGLQVHDVGGFMKDNLGACIDKPEGHPYLRLTRVVEPSHVFTIEPGLYFTQPLLDELQKSDNAKFINWKKVDEFRKFGGIRIEDDIVVTDNGHENLTREAFAKAQ